MVLGLGLGLGLAAKNLASEQSFNELFPGATALCSLRNLNDPSSAVVRVRRNSNDDEQDFTAAEITDGTLLTFVGNQAGDDGFVTTLYDQSSNSNDMSQSTAANQMKLVEDGVVLVDGNGLPYMQSDGSDDFYDGPSVAQPFTLYYTFENQAGGGTRWLGAQFAKSGGANWGLNFGAFLAINGVATADLQLADFTINSENASVYKNGVSVGSGAVGPNAFNNQIGSGLVSAPQRPYELIIYDNDTDRVGIQQNIIDYYGI